MGKNNYIELYIGGKKADIDPNGQIPTISYHLEDEEKFEVKKSSEAFDIQLPSTLANDQIHNTIHNPGVVDNTPQQLYDNFQTFLYKGNGLELMIGKYLTQSSIKRFGRPEKYKGRAHGMNADWALDMKEKTIYDFLNANTHTFDAATIINSWSYDGMNEGMDYVYAPVRYRKAFGIAPDPTNDNPNPVPPDDNCTINDMKPSISPFWILQRGFRYFGYRIVSKFMDSAYYRRSTLLWTWGGFDFLDDSRWEPLKFLAGQAESQRFEGDHDDEFPNLNIAADGSVPGTFDNNGLFEYTNGASTIPWLMKWQYPTSPSNLNLGKVRINFSVDVSWAYKVQQNSDASLYIFWYLNGAQMEDNPVYSQSAPAVGTRQASGFTEMFYEVDLNPGDWVGARARIHLNQTSAGFARQDLWIQSFKINFVKLTNGSTIDFRTNYPKFKNYKWIDLLMGEIDLFDLSIQTDPIKKEVYIEPTHAYEINGNDYEGYYNRKLLDWDQKVDISQETELVLFSDYDRELSFQFLDDNSDGGLKKVQDRNQTTIGQGKYVLPERYKSTKKTQENRFYSAVMHYEHKKFQQVTGVSPQLIAIIPENISNTSSSESENTYNPKRAWYKGNIEGYGGWVFDNQNYSTLPFMFAVNYKPGGHTDPVLSYSDQSIGGVIAKGLMKKFYLPRLAILRNGRRYMPIYIMLNNLDIFNFLHRESVVIENMEYLITSIKEYNPIEPDISTAVNMWQFVSPTPTDGNNCYPSIKSIQNTGVTNSFDLKYWPHLLLTSDIPA